MELEAPQAPRPLTVFGGESRLTRNEQIIYRELCANARPMKAYALLERVHQQGLRAPMTVYRALNALIRHGLAKKVASMNAFVALRHDAGKTAEAFITCRTCGRTMGIGLTRRQVEEIFSPAGMQVGDVFIEAYGDCGASDCKKPNTETSQESGGAGPRRDQFRDAKARERAMITCFIKYEIDPFKKDAFETYARNWGRAIPRCGGDLIGYFAPHEGSATTAYGVYTLPSLAAYEDYKARLAADPLGKENYEFAKAERFITREDRIFLKLASAPHASLKTF